MEKEPYILTWPSLYVHILAISQLQGITQSCLQTQASIQRYLLAEIRAHHSKCLTWSKTCQVLGQGPKVLVCTQPRRLKMLLFRDRHPKYLE